MRLPWPSPFAAILVAGVVLFAAPLQAQKTLRVAFPIAENGLDPQVIYDEYSAKVCNVIFDTLYMYDYFARPVKLVPNTADGMPVVSDGGRTFTVKVKPGIFFASHPAFGGKKRELTAHDYVYSMKRIFDPKIRSYYLYLFENRLVGLDAPLAEARKSGKFDYDAPIEGLRALDKYTLQIRMKAPDYAVPYWLASTVTAAVAKEVIAAKGDASGRVMEDPVGTGPYKLAEWRRSQRIVLEANPDFRDVRFPTPPPGSPPEDFEVAKGLSGRKLPLVPRVEISVIEESQPRLLAFRSKNLDYVDVPSSLATTVLDGSKLKLELAAAGVKLHRQVEPSLGFFFFNMDDPVVGGYSPEKVALRRAIVMAQDRRERNLVVRNGQAELATQMIPPPVPGHSPALAMKDPYDPVAARALLDRFGYKDRDGDGYRESPEGKPIVLVKGAVPTAAERAANELWKKNLDAIGLRTDFFVEKWPELNKRSEAGQLMIWDLAWIAGYPDADNFYSPLYSRNIGLSNDARLRSAEYDTAYEAMRALPEGPERVVQYRKMNDVIQAYAPWILDAYAYQNQLVQPWVKGIKLHPFYRDRYQYFDVAR